MANHLQGLKVGRVSLVDRAAVRDPANPSQPRTFLLFKSAAATTSEEGAPVTEIKKDDLDPAVREALEKAEKEAADATAAAEVAKKEAEDAKAALAKANDNDSDDEKEDPTKKIKKEELTPEVRAIVEKAEADSAAAEERIAKAEKDAAEASTIAKDERDKRSTTEWITKAETGELRGLPGAPADIGPVMKSLAEAAPDAWATFEKSVLVPAVAQLKEGALFKEQGAGGEGPPPESALAKFNEKVEELRKADASISNTDAKQRVSKSNPELMQQLHTELGAGTARP